METNKILITLHGGNFTGGDLSYNKKQNNAIKTHIPDIEIIDLDFPKDNYEETIEWLDNELKKINDKGKPIFILGRSSGGYLAKQLYERNKNKLDIYGVIYMAPVFNPVKRAEIHKKFKSEQDKFFRNTTKIPDTNNFDKNFEVLFLAKNDENVPIDCFTFEQKISPYNIYLTDLNIKTHTGICTTTSEKFKNAFGNIITQLLYNFPYNKKIKKQNILYQ